MPKVLVIGTDTPKPEQDNIGKAIARELISDNCRAAMLEGWDVDTPSRTSFNVMNLAHMAEMEWGNYHSVVYSAGLCMPNWIWKQKDRHIFDQVDVTLTGALVCLSRFIDKNLDHQQENKFSVRRFVIIGSAAAETPHRGQAPYNAAKAGLRAGVATVAREVHTMGFRVFLLEPGAVSGTPYSDTVALGAKMMGLDSRAGAVRGTFGRNLKTGEVAHMVRAILHGSYDWLAGRPIPYSGGPQ